MEGKCSTKPSMPSSTDVLSTSHVNFLLVSIARLKPVGLSGVQKRQKKQKEGDKTKKPGVSSCVNVIRLGECCEVFPGLLEKSHQDVPFIPTANRLVLFERVAMRIQGSQILEIAMSFDLWEHITVSKYIKVHVLWMPVLFKVAE